MGPVPTNSMQQKIQQTCDPDMTRLSFARVVFMEQTYYCAKVVLCSVYTFILFPYSSCMSPASAFGHAGTSASNRQAQKLERIWGDTDHQGNKATTGNARVKTRVESRNSPPCFTKGSLCLSEKLHSWCPCCSLGFELLLDFCLHAESVLFCLQQLFSLPALHHH